jgi:hypothetical protein
VTLAEIQAKQIRSEGFEPVLCGACEWPGHVIERAEHSVLVRHLGRAWPCRTSSAEPIADTAEDALEDE